MADRELEKPRRLTGVAGETKAIQIHIDGVVQGVGFRPFIYGLALDLELTGWVRNSSAGVDIEVEGESAAIDDFIALLQPKAPPLAHIDNIEWDWIPTNGYSEFIIRQSQAAKGDFQPISADVSMCDDCRTELLDKSDRRYRYPFINCTNCGPRFTIIHALPYDRPATTMADFELCPDCAAEYSNPLDRRFHAQPIACPRCGPHVWLEIGDEKASEKSEAIQQARQIIQDGGIIGIKGLGGYQLACNAADPEAVQRLRRIKARAAKPFALMVPDLKSAARLCSLNDIEREMLQSRERPILLLDKQTTAPVADEVAPGQTSLGIMLPYTPLHELLLQPGPDYPLALVMTSANHAGQPIQFENKAASAAFAEQADAMLHHNRPIEQRCDDSVYRVFRGEQYPVRRARGFAPYPVHVPANSSQLFAAGAELKNTFCLTKQGYAFLSQHIGDLTNYETLLAYQDALEHFIDIFQITPEGVAYDLHPNYLSTQFALEYSQRNDIPAIAIQHHQAHIAACLAEHQWDFEEAVIGLAFDGTGYGLDGAIWGGEVFTVDRGQFSRDYHLKYIPLPGGDQAVRQPWRTALAWLEAAGLEWETNLAPVAAVGERERQLVRQQIIQGINAPQTSSMGRLFDAVASLIGLRHLVDFEAQAAMELEALVEPHEAGAYHLEIVDGVLDPTSMVRQIVAEVEAGVSASTVATRFHRGLAQACVAIALALRADHGINTVALSGGVWQNFRLLEWTYELLVTENFNVLTHRQVPTNDGGLSLGQAWLADNYFKRGRTEGLIQ